MVMFKILVKSPKNPFWIFQAFEIFTKEIFSKNSKKILACHIRHFGGLAKYHVLENKITSSNPLKTISVHFEVCATLH